VGRALAVLVTCTVTSLTLVATNASSASADLTSNYLVSSIINTSDLCTATFESVFVK